MKVPANNGQVVDISLAGLCKPSEHTRVSGAVHDLRHVHRGGKQVGAGVRVEKGRKDIRREKIWDRERGYNRECGSADG